MDTHAQPNPNLDHDAIAQLAWQIWQKEGCQNGRDVENWLQAEELLAIRQSVTGQPEVAPAKPKSAPATRKKSARQSSVPAN